MSFSSDLSESKPIRISFEGFCLLLPEAIFSNGKGFTSFFFTHLGLYSWGRYMVIHAKRPKGKFKFDSAGHKEIENEVNQTQS